MRRRQSKREGRKGRVIRFSFRERGGGQMISGRGKRSTLQTKESLADNKRNEDACKQATEERESWKQKFQAPAQVSK